MAAFFYVRSTLIDLGPSLGKQAAGHSPRLRQALPAKVPSAESMAVPFDVFCQVKSFLRRFLPDYRRFIKLTHP
jgi:hypothetical protein